MFTASCLMLAHPLGGEGTSEAVPSWRMIWAIMVSPGRIPAGAETFRVVTAVLESASGLVPTKVMVELGVGVAVGVGEGGIDADR